MQATIIAPVCSGCRIRVSLAEMYANRCDRCKTALHQPVKPVVRIRRIGKQLRMVFPGIPQYIQ